MRKTTLNSLNLPHSKSLIVFHKQACLFSTFFFQTYVYVNDSDGDTPQLELETIKDFSHKTSVNEESYNASAHISLWEPRLRFTKVGCL